MRQNKKVKIITITSLCLAVVGLTLGFAAFSNQLTISSSATISPDSSDFKITAYGISDTSISMDNITDKSFDSTTLSVPFTSGGTVNCSNHNK